MKSNEFNSIQWLNHYMNLNPNQMKWNDAIN